MNTVNVNDPQAYQAACDRMRSAPTTLTECDFEVLRSVSPSLEHQAHQLRLIAQLSRAPIAPPPALITKSLPAVDDADAVAAAIVRRINAALAPVLERLAAAEQDVRELKNLPQLKHCGPWIEGQSYSEGSFVTRKGGMWLAIRPRPDTPGAPGSGWRLVVKEGTAR
jgi:hypothetical protein